MLKTKNISTEALDRYRLRLGSEKYLILSNVESMWPTEKSPIIPDYFAPQFHPVHTDQELRSAFFVNENGFYSYPKPMHYSINVNILKNVYEAAIKLNISRAQDIGLFNECIMKYTQIIYALLERYQYDIETSQQLS